MTLRFADPLGAARPLHALLLAGALLIMVPSMARAQHWSDGVWPGADWALAMAQFDSVWTDSLPAKGKGFKPFMRWRHFAEARWAFEGGSAFKSASAWSATRWERQGRAARLDQPDTVWRRAVPAGLPLVGGAGRVNRVVIDPQDTLRWFACAPSGGLWQSLDSGNSWEILNTNDWSGMGVSDIALHPDAPQDILAATGDSDFGSAYSVGLMATTDGGNTWNTTGLTFGLSDAATCSRVHRKAGAPNEVLVASTDGIWLSEDGGATFDLTLEGHCSDLVPHPGDSAIWHAALRPGEVYRSEDGGRHWTAASGMPDPYQISRYTLATSPTNPQKVVAIAAKNGTQGLEGVYVSEDAGITYAAIPDVPNLLGWTYAGSDFGGQGFYDLALAIDPLDDSHMVAGGVNLWETWDGGVSWSCIGHWYGEQDADFVHADHHAVTFVPGSSDWVSAHDGGVARWTPDGFADRSDGLEIGQVYALGFADQRPDRLISGWQDNGINLLNAEVHAQVLGADGFHCLIDPNQPDTLIAAEYFGKTHRSLDGGWSWNLWVGSNESGVNERGDWNTPMAFSPSDPDRTFIAKHRLYWTDDGGQNWQQTDALPGAEMEVLALAPSHDSTAVVARGTLAFLTQDLNAWTPVSGLPDLPVLDVAFDEADANVWWIGFGGYDPNNRVWVTTDGGENWSSAGTGLPALPVNTIAVHHQSDDLYAGTDAGVYVLPAGSNNWTPYKSGLPDALCSDLGIRASTGEVLLATYGSGLWRAPVYTPQDRDAAIMGITGHRALTCSGPLDLRATVRNAGADTLVALSLLWNGTDTVNYGMLLPPGEEQALEWPTASRDAVPQGGELVVRLLEVVGVSGGLSNGTLTAGVDAVAENDVFGVNWEHQSGRGRVVMVTTADCTPMETSWAVADSTGAVWHRRQHFPIESTKRDTLCLSRGCFEVWLHDGGHNGFSWAPCGMEGALWLESISGDTIWSVTDSASAGIDFQSGMGGSFCLPVPGWMGCTDEAACNFDPSAAQDDGTCHFDCLPDDCPLDLDGDGYYGASDILTLLAEFGCLAQCTVDITGDGTVSAQDILAYLALYGESCEE